MAYAKLDLRDVVIDPDGVLNAGGFVQSYAATTTTPLVTYSDGLGTENTNPVTLDASGQWACYLEVGVAYKFEFQTPDSVAFYTADNVVISDTTSDPGSQYVDVVFTYPGGPPAALGWIGGETFTRAVSFPANFTGSFGKARTNATASFVATIRKNSTTYADGTAVGTVTVATNGTYAFATTAGAVITFAIGDNIDAWGPAVADTTIANFGFTLAGSLV